MLSSKQLDAYRNRVHYDGPTNVCLTTLHGLTRAHVQRIAFENMDVLLGQTPAIDETSVFDKLVLKRRGGYCFEQNRLLKAVLRTLGFDVTPLGARVRLRTSDRSVMPGRTHLLLQVKLNDALWITDVGFGGYSLTQALQVQSGLVQDTPHGLRRLMNDEGRWFHQVCKLDEWIDVYELDLQPMYPRDQIIANWYTSTHVDSQFVDNLTIALACHDGSRVSLYNNLLRRTQADGNTEIQALAREEILATLCDIFHLDVSQPDRLLERLVMQTVQDGQDNL